MSKKRWMLMALSAVLLLGLLAGCSQELKVPLTAQGFTDLMEANDYVVEDQAGSTDTVNAHLSADLGGYWLNFMEFHNTQSATEAYESMKTVLLENNSSQALKKDTTNVRTVDGVERANRHLSFVSGDLYHLLIQVDHTQIICSAPKEHRAQVNELMKSLGYA